MKEYAFGIDLGGTTAKIGLFKTTGELLEKWEVPTDTSNAGEHILENLAAAVQGKMQEKGLAAAQVEGVGVGVPGPVLDSRIVPIICANLGGWGKHNVAEELSTMLGGIRVLVGNDANVAALGEIWMGAAKGCRSAVMVTLGTGVGGGVIINGKIYSGFNSFGGELGHTVIVYNGEPCPCGRRGCLESYASATALIKQTRESMKNHTESRLWKICPNISEINGKTAFDAMRAGSKAGAEVVNRYINYLGCGLTNFINVFQPEMLLIGGGVSKEGETLLDPLRKILAVETYGSDMDAPKTKIGVCTLRNDAGTIGAANLHRLYES